jgi:hypothetical protein
MAYFSKVKTNALYVDKFLVNRSRDLDNRGAVLTAEHGAGAIGTAFAPRTYRWSENGHIITEIQVDLTGLGPQGDAARDAIGLGAGGAAYIGRYVTATYGIVYRVEMMCIELPAGTTITTDIDLEAEASGTIAHDGACSDEVVIASAALVAGEVVVNNVPALVADRYFYLTEGDTAATGGHAYTAGQYIIRFYGHALIS